MVLRLGGILILLALGATVPAARTGAQGTGTADRDSVEARSERLAAGLLPAVAALIGVSEYGPVTIEARTKTELRAMITPLLREFYGEEALRRRSRVSAALGLVPPGYDLAAGYAELLIEIMGGGYDVVHEKYYVLIDLPSAMADPTVQKMVAAHELTHALQDQQRKMAGEMRRGATDWDYGFVWNAVTEGMAYQAMMAVTAGVPLAAAPDATPMLAHTQAAMAASADFPVYARTPAYVRDTIFGPALSGLAFVRAYMADHADRPAVDLLHQVPASGEQVLHYEKFVAGELPSAIDLSTLDGRVPDTWQPFLAGSLGEFDVLALCAEHAATRDSASTVAGGWDGCRFVSYTTSGGELVLLGLSAWDSARDAAEWSAGYARILAGCHGPERFAIEQAGQTVRFVIGPAATHREMLSLLATASPAD